MYAEWERPISKSHIWYDSIYVTVSKGQKHWWFPGKRGGDREMGVTIKGITRNLCADGTVLYLDCDGGYTNLHMTTLHRALLVHIHTHNEFM